MRYTPPYEGGVRSQRPLTVKLVYGYSANVHGEVSIAGVVVRSFEGLRFAVNVYLIGGEGDRGYKGTRSTNTF